jgi:dTDP-4-dehydrorhamnose reductase
LTRPETLLPVLSLHRPDVVFNCAAYNFVDRAEDEPAAAFAVNAIGVLALAAACRTIGCLLVHFSTDHVFGIDESRRLPYAETDPTGPVNIYGCSKHAGEQLAGASGARHLVIRTCGLYGRRGEGGKGTNFVEAILKRAAAGEPLRVVSDQECSPTATADLARAAIALASSGAEGLFHLTSAGACTWFQLAETIVRHAGLRATVIPVTSAEYGARARRPSYSVLDCSKASQAGVAPLRPWPEALRDYLATRSR